MGCGVAIFLAVAGSGCSNDSGPRRLSETFKTQNALPLTGDLVGPAAQKLRDMQAQPGGSEKIRAWVEDSLLGTDSTQLRDVLVDIAGSLSADDPTMSTGRNTDEESTFRVVVGATYGGLLLLEKDESSKGRADLPMSTSTRKLVEQLLPSASWKHGSSDNLERIFMTLVPKKQRESVSVISSESAETVWFERNIRAMEWGLRSRTVN